MNATPKRARARIVAGAAIFFCAALAAALLLPQFPLRFRGTGRIAPTISSERIERISVSREGDVFTVNLSKSNGSWSLAVDESHRYPAEEGKVERLLESLSERQTIVRVAPGRGENYGIGAVGSCAITLTDGSVGGTETIRFGETDAAGRWVYFSRAGNDAVFRVSSSIAEFLDNAAASWTTLTPFAESLEKGDVQEIAIECGSVFRAGHDEEIDAFTMKARRFTCLDVTNAEIAGTVAFTISYGYGGITRVRAGKYGDEWWVIEILEQGFGARRAYVVSASAATELFDTLDIR